MVRGARATSQEVLRLFERPWRCRQGETNGWKGERAGRGRESTNADAAGSHQGQLKLDYPLPVHESEEWRHVASQRGMEDEDEDGMKEMTVDAQEPGLII